MGSIYCTHTPTHTRLAPSFPFPALPVDAGQVNGPASGLCRSQEKASGAQGVHPPRISSLRVTNHNPSGAAISSHHPRTQQMVPVPTATTGMERSCLQPCPVAAAHHQNTKHPAMSPPKASPPSPLPLCETKTGEEKLSLEQTHRLRDEPGCRSDQQCTWTPCLPAPCTHAWQRIISRPWAVRYSWIKPAVSSSQETRISKFGFIPRVKTQK